MRLFEEEVFVSEPSVVLGGRGQACLVPLVEQEELLDGPAVCDLGRDSQDLDQVHLQVPVQQLEAGEVQVQVLDQISLSVKMTLALTTEPLIGVGFEIRTEELTLCEALLLYSRLGMTEALEVPLGHIWEGLTFGPRAPLTLFDHSGVLDRELRGLQQGVLLGVPGSPELVRGQAVQRSRPLSV